MALIVLLGLFACTKVDDDTGPADTEADADTDTDTDADTDTGFDECAPDTTAALSGCVTNIEGTPLKNIRMTMCRENCIVATTDRGGAYAFPTLPDGRQAFDAVPGGDYATVLVPLTYTEGSNMSVDVQVPEIAWQSMPTSSTEVEMASGVFVTLAQGELEYPFGADESRTGGVAVDQANWPPLELEGTPTSVHYLAPYDAKSDGLSFRISADAAGVADGDTVQIVAADYLEYDWHDMGTFTVTDGWITGDNLTVLSTLVVVKP
jgi:hypothetical protein